MYNYIADKTQEKKSSIPRSPYFFMTLEYTAMTCAKSKTPAGNAVFDLEYNTKQRSPANPIEQLLLS